MGKLTVGSKHPAYERKCTRMFALIAFERDVERAGPSLHGARENGFAKAAECTDVLTFGRQHVNDVRRQATEHAHGEVEPVRNRDV